MIPESYDVRVEGILTPALRHAFPTAQVSVEKGATVTTIRLPIRQQSELGRLLAQIDGLGLIVVDVSPTRRG